MSMLEAARARPPSVEGRYQNSPYVLRSQETYGRSGARLELTRFFLESIIGLSRGLHHAKTDLPTEETTARPSARLQSPHEHPGRSEHAEASHVQRTPQAHCLTGPFDGHAKGPASHQVEGVRGDAALRKKLVGQIPCADCATGHPGPNALRVFRWAGELETRSCVTE